MVTFGDMMALLLTFFVLLLSFSQMDIVKFEEAAGHMTTAFGVQRMEQRNPIPSGEKEIANEFSQEVILVRLKESLINVLISMIDNGEAEVEEEAEGFLVRLSGDALFVPNTSHIRPEMEPMLQQIANELATQKNLVRIVGHTDDHAPDPNSPYPSSWARSIAMSSSVTDFLVTKGGIEPRRLEARGKGSFNPRASNATSGGRAQNQRIEIRVSHETQPEDIAPTLEEPGTGNPLSPY
jgi:chemotaxis protein MotB